MAEKSTEKKGLFDKIGGFFKSLRSETRKITWPGREQLAKQSAAVMIISVILCGFIRLIDVLTQLLIKAVGSIF